MPPPSGTLPELTTLSSSSPDSVPRFISIVGSAFSDTALTNAFIAEIDGISSPCSSSLVTPARRRQHFESGITEASHSNAILVQAGGWSAIALWEPPDFKGKAFSDSRRTVGPILLEWRQKVKGAKVRYLSLSAEDQKHGNGVPDDESMHMPPTHQESDITAPTAETSEMKLRPFYHLAFLARNPDVPSVPGAISAVVLPFLDRARNEGVPAWLEATTPHAAAVYQHFGFRVVDHITIGVGKINADGWPEEGGQGVTSYAMIYDSHLQTLSH